MAVLLLALFRIAVWLDPDGESSAIVVGGPGERLDRVERGSMRMACGVRDRRARAKGGA
jgi:hypothetical protein